MLRRWVPAGSSAQRDGGRSGPSRPGAGSRLEGGELWLGFGSGSTGLLAVRAPSAAAAAGLPREATRGGGERPWRRPAAAAERGKGGGAVTGEARGQALSCCELRPLGAPPPRGSVGASPERRARPLERPRRLRAPGARAVCSSAARRCDTRGACSPGRSLSGCVICLQVLRAIRKVPTSYILLSLQMLGKRMEGMASTAWVRCLFTRSRIPGSVCVTVNAKLENRC